MQTIDDMISQRITEALTDPKTITALAQAIAAHIKPAEVTSPEDKTELVSMRSVGKILNLNHRTLLATIQSDHSFPKPTLITTGGQRKWTRAQIERWIERQQRH